jgi:hypothetical protein
MHRFALADRWPVNATGPAASVSSFGSTAAAPWGTFVEIALPIRRMQRCLAPRCRSERLAVGQQVASDADPDGLSVTIAGRA